MVEAGPGTLRIEGPWEADKLYDKLQFSTGEGFDTVSERHVIGKVAMPTPIIDRGALDLEYKFAFTPVMRFEKEEVPLLAAIGPICRVGPPNPST